MTQSQRSKSFKTQDCLTAQKIGVIYMKKILKYVLIIILLVIVIALIHIFRNYFIIRKLQKNIEAYTSSTNYHIKTESADTVANYYKKGEKQVIIVEKYADDKNTRLSVYNTGERIDMFIEEGENKIARLNSVTVISIEVNNYLKTDNNWQTFLACTKAKIKKVDYDGKECYLIDNFITPMFINGEQENKAYIEKDSGLCLRMITDGEVVERKYEFNNVDESVFEEPDISQFTIQEISK